MTYIEAACGCRITYDAERVVIQVWRGNNILHSMTLCLKCYEKKS